ncbi:MAG TPA: phosphopantetheine-binding protein [Mycobacterium sp.]
MSPADTRTAVLAVLTRIAPEVDPGEIRDDLRLREQVDLDSMDWLRFLIGINEVLHVDIPESDYAGLRTLHDVVSYADQHSAPR